LFLTSWTLGAPNTILEQLIVLTVLMRGR
jgi:hypothetical protein